MNDYRNIKKAAPLEHLEEERHELLGYNQPQTTGSINQTGVDLNNSKECLDEMKKISTLI